MFVIDPMASDFMFNLANSFKARGWKRLHIKGCNQHGECSICCDQQDEFTDINVSIREANSVGEESCCQLCWCISVNIIRM